MSVIIRDANKQSSSSSKSVRILCKGADSVMASRLASSRNMNDEDMLKRSHEHLQSFAEEGLRCLFVASAWISEDAYNDWSRRYSEAKSDLQQIERSVALNTLFAIETFYCCECNSNRAGGRKDKLI
jgi:phospholipid-translocating ATPase